jgi:hypothetical protein
MESGYWFHAPSRVRGDHSYHMAAAYVQVRGGARRLSIVARSLILGYQGLFPMLGRMLGTDILRPGPSPSSAAIQPSWNCSRTLPSLTLPSDSDRLLNTPRWPYDHFNPPKPDVVDASIRGGPCPLTGRAGCGCVTTE